MKFLFLISFSFSFFYACGQDWEIISDEFSGPIKEMYHDPISDLFFIGGQFGFLGEDQIGGICAYNGDSIISFGCAYDCYSPYSNLVNGALSILSFNDTLYLNGIATNGASVDSLFNFVQNSQGVLSYTDGEFSALNVPFQNDDYIVNTMRLFKVDDSLYVTADHLGNVAGYSGYGAAKYNGAEWSPFFIPSCYDFIGVSGLVKYNSELYISGQFQSCDGVIADDIMKWNGEEWELVGSPIVSSVSGAVKKMAVFQNELYVCGIFFRDSGNAGECIMKWNGEVWSDLGSGLSANGLNTVEDMVILNDELYISGRFTEVGGMAANNLAKWDGNQWCVLNNDFSAFYLRALGVYQGELYVSVPTQQYSNRLWKWTGTATNCSEEFNSINEQNKPSSLTLYPNPASDLLTITLPKQLHGSGTISITDGLGRTVEEFNQEIEAGSQMTIATLNLPKGLYTLKFRHEEGVYAARFVKE
ncbi:MAG: T9SS type A sorting domain-containing protein [Flavobacteriales bacterium]